MSKPAVNLRFQDNMDALFEQLADRGTQFVSAVSREVAKEVKREAPRGETGNLRRMTKAKRSRKSRKTKGLVFGGVRLAPHAHLVALGHDIYAPAGGGQWENTGRRTRPNDFHVRSMEKVKSKLAGIAQRVAARDAKR